MDFDPALLARLQFAFTVTFHIIFPSFTIGLSAYIATLGVMWVRTGEDRYQQLMRFWTKIFAVSFAMGVVSGIVLSYEFGTNWSRFSLTVGNVIGPAIGYEVLMAFFLEATFLGVLLFGFSKVPPWLYVLSAAIVAFGTATSAFWILSANSWMQTPQGYALQDGVFRPVDWTAIVFNPSFPYRFMHMAAAAFLTTAFAVGGIGAWYLLSGRRADHGRVMVGMAVSIIVWLAPLQLILGDMHGLNVREHQPAKLAAMEGDWRTQRGAPLILIAWPDMEQEMNHFELAIPRIGSLILTHSWDGEVTGLKAFEPQDRPPAPIVFWSFRIMVGIGLLMLLVAGLSALLFLRRRLFDSRWFLRLLVLCSPLGFVAVIAGWVTAEVGRQPWVVYGQLRTADAVSPVPGASVLLSLLLFILVYGVIFGAGLYYIAKTIRQGAAGHAPDPEPMAPRRPMAAADYGD
ncbi:MAG TPA: cytochrome ubiquinol oxidase subunit I [Candidatus Acidoferrum sp.]|nr:cytochrome ubiquinol oxidase subunit I [Candidatus Acidoferrum sp.]